MNGGIALNKRTLTIIVITIAIAASIAAVVYLQLKLPVANNNPIDIGAKPDSEQEEILGNYIFSEQIYVNPPGSFMALGDYVEYYTVLPDKLVLTDAEGLQRVETISLNRSEFDENGFKEMFLYLDSLEGGDLFGKINANTDAYSECREYILSPEYRVYTMDDEIWLARTTTAADKSGKQMFWSIYKIKPYEGVIPKVEKTGTSGLQSGLAAVEIAGETKDTVNQSSKPGDVLEKAIVEAIMEQNQNSFLDGGYATESHIILKTVTDDQISSNNQTTRNNSAIVEFPTNTDNATTTDNVTTIYAMVMYMTFSDSGEGIAETGGSHMPVALTFKQDSGIYTLEEYWTPKDGSLYISSIREKFPQEIFEQAIDTQLYVYLQIQECYDKAIRHLDVDTTAVVVDLLKTICSSPLEASNPKAYIDAHVIEYRSLIYYGDYTLKYCFDLFEKGGQNGLEGHIMAAACRDILAIQTSEQITKYKDTEDSQFFNTGQAWYDAVLSQ